MIISRFTAGIFIFCKFVAMKARRKKNNGTRVRPRRLRKQLSLKSGLPPESLVHIGQVFLEQTKAELIRFSPDEFSQTSDVRLEDISMPDDSSFTWLKITGLHEVERIGQLGRQLNISQLMLEDVLNTGHRPKMEEDGNYIFFTLRNFILSENEILSEQVSFLLGKNFLISFQESEQPVFEPVVSRLSSAMGKIRQRGTDFLLYNLIDVVVDRYYTILEDLGDQLEDLEDQIFQNPEKELIGKNQLLRKNIITIRKALLPTQEALNMLIKSEPELIDEPDLPYFSDIIDHVNQCIDFVDTYRELSAEIKESYLSNLSYKMNQVVKLLTIITTIFIPLSFIAGIYGMNFRNMPELEWRYGYYALLGLMLLMIVSMLAFFRRKKWL
jgi:magnesium transporter